ncbi:MAG: hypothetical protein A3F14_04605 [Gammaproteobacteria bacterium RIFCSPHIGHO2_12_FULL_43_28]|nr:MAG: hypothetical protein A3F14_04605 [Gammaproteobacteria bacterium RIFCSPHIGHO2_12_FULL_43_28]
MYYIKLVGVSLLSLGGLNQAHAWQHEIAVGYGFGKEIDQNYRNQGIVISGKLYKFPNIDETLIASIDGTLAHIRAKTDEHKRLTTAALSLAMRAYFADPLFYQKRPYLQVTFGPAFLSAEELGNRSQGAHFAFQSTFETGMEIGSIDLNLKFMHYCNAGIFHPNQGINLVSTFSLGYMF